MTVILAFLEGSILFSAVCGMTFLWIHPLLVNWLDVAAVVGQAGVVTGCCIVAFYYNDLYNLQIVRDFGEFASRLLQSFGVAFILLAGCYFLFPATRLAEGPFASSLLLIAGALLPLRAVSYTLMRSRPFLERVLILGTSPLAHRLIGEIRAHPHFRYAVVGVVEDASPAGDPPGGMPLLGPLAQLGKIIEEVEPDRVVVALSERRGRLSVHQLLEARLQGVLVEDGPDTYERLTGKLALESLRPSNLIFSRDFRKSRGELAVGRAVSLVAAVVGLALFAPLMVLIAVAIKLESPGPVFFIQAREGLHGTHFRLIKFRTMRSTTGATSEWGRDNSDRITRVGGWLRKFRLDELPQFLNILRGDLNLVGPRPHPVSNVPLFLAHIPYYALRSAVRPGVTGWAQVRYGYANTLEEETEKMRYDLFYIKHRSVGLDLRILFETVKIVLFGRGSKAADVYPRDAVMGVSRR